MAGSALYQLPVREQRRHAADLAGHRWWRPIQPDYHHLAKAVPGLDREALHAGLRYPLERIRRGVGLLRSRRAVSEPLALFVGFTQERLRVGGSLARSQRVQSRQKRGIRELGAKRVEHPAHPRPLPRAQRPLQKPPARSRARHSHRARVRRLPAHGQPPVPGPLAEAQQPRAHLGEPLLQVPLLHQRAGLIQRIEGVEYLVEALVFRRVPGRSALQLLLDNGDPRVELSDHRLQACRLFGRRPALLLQGTEQLIQPGRANSRAIPIRIPLVRLPCLGATAACRAVRRKSSEKRAQPVEHAVALPRSGPFAKCFVTVQGGPKTGCRVDRLRAARPETDRIEQPTVLEDRLHCTGCSNAAYERRGKCRG